MPRGAARASAHAGPRTWSASASSSGSSAAATTSATPAAGPSARRPTTCGSWACWPWTTGARTAAARTSSCTIPTTATRSASCRCAAAATWPGISPSGAAPAAGRSSIPRNTPRWGRTPSLSPRERAGVRAIEGTAATGECFPGFPSHRPSPMGRGSQRREVECRTVNVECRRKRRRPARETGSAMDCGGSTPLSGLAERAARGKIVRSPRLQARARCPRGHRSTA